MASTRYSRNLSNAEKSVKLHTRKRDSWKKTLEKHNRQAKAQVAQLKKNLKGAVLTMVMAYIRADNEKYRTKYLAKIAWHQSRIDINKERIKTLKAKAK